jgi:hypothetical protein
MNQLRNIRLLVCGGRNYAARDTAFAALDAIDRKIGVGLVIEGGAPGADTIAWQWAKAHTVPFIEFRADWRKHGKAAGPLRNQEMIDDGKPDAVVALQGGRGTADMVDKARRAGIPVWVVEDVPYVSINTRDERGVKQPLDEQTAGAVSAAAKLLHAAYSIEMQIDRTDSR